jgi:uncharacterized HAD superfamily protein
MKISFDFDGVLETAKGQETAQRLMQSNDVFIITARNKERMSKAVYEVADKLNIPYRNVIFTNGADKWKAINDKNIDVHYDNNNEQLSKIKANTKAKGVKV